MTSRVQGQEESLLDEHTASELRFAQWARHVGIVGIAGAATGVVVGGAGGRLLMKIAAIAAPDQATGRLTENGNRIGEFTVGGTMELIIFVGILAGGIGAVAYLIAEPWLAWARWGRGLAFGLLLMAAASTVAFDPDNVDFVIVGSEPLIVGMFLSLFLLYGVLLAWSIRLLERRLPGVNEQRPLQSVGAYLGLAALGFPFVFALLGLFFFSGFCGCDPAYLTGIFVVGMGIATIVLWTSATADRHRARWVTAAQVVGFGSLAGALVAGTLRATDDVAAIL